MSELSVNQAFENVAQAVAAYRGTLADHQLLQQSLSVLRAALQGQPAYTPFPSLQEREPAEVGAE
jgi:hypothetical protein